MNVYLLFLTPLLLLLLLHHSCCCLLVISIPTSGLDMNYLDTGDGDGNPKQALMKLRKREHLRMGNGGEQLGNGEEHMGRRSNVIHL